MSSPNHNSELSQDPERPAVGSKDPTSDRLFSSIKSEISGTKTGDKETTGKGDKEKTSTKDDKDGISNRDTISIKQEINALSTLLGDIDKTTIGFDKNRDNKLTKEELLGQVKDDHFYSELIKYFDQAAPKGYLDYQQSEKRQEQLEAELSKRAKARTFELANRAEMEKDARAFLPLHNEPAIEAISNAVATNDITMLSRPIGDVLSKLCRNKELPQGTVLALMEVPKSLEPLFDKFNGTEQGSEKALDSLRGNVNYPPEFFEAMKAIHDAGYSIAAVGDEKLTGYGDLESRGGGTNDLEQNRETAIAANLLALRSENKGKPILAIGDRLHGARHYQGINSFKSAGYLIGNDARFKKDNGRIATFDTVESLPPGAMPDPNDIRDLAKGVEEPISVRTRLGNKVTPIGQLSSNSSEELQKVQGDYREDAFDFVIFRKFDEASLKQIEPK